MFARIGVTLVWRDPGRCPGGALHIKFSRRDSVEYPPDVLGYAYPYEGSHIVVFWNRIEAAVSGHDVAPVLAHVMAHEITHVLEGCTRHSPSGLMKAHWSTRDFREMTWKPLPFAEEDIDLIRLGLAQREHSVPVGDGR
jgi:hypothetical protein